MNCGLTVSQNFHSPARPGNIIEIKWRKYETARQNKPDQGIPEEKNDEKEPEKVQGAKQVFSLIKGSCE
jgi:hypothetical protein